MRDEALIIPVVALTIPIVVAPVAMVMKYLQKRRELTHRERMRALELGHPATAPSTWPAAFAAVGIGAGVPLGSFLMAWLANLSEQVGPEVFGFAMIVGVVALVQGGRLAGRLASAPTPSHPAPTAPPLNGKPPAYDPDAFDVVSRRG